MTTSLAVSGHRGSNYIKQIDSEHESFDTLRRKRWFTICCKICLAIFAQLCGCIFTISFSRKLEQIPVRDTRRFLADACGLVKEKLDNAECGAEGLQQHFYWGLGLDQAPCYQL